MLAKTLKWPVICLLVAGGIHIAAEVAMPDLKTIFVPSVLSPLLLAFGAWAGYRAVQNGGNLVHAILSGAILGLMAVVLHVGVFGMMLGRGVEPELLGGIATLCLMVWGSLVGGGFALSK